MFLVAFAAVAGRWRLSGLPCTGPRWNGLCPEASAFVPRTDNLRQRLGESDGIESFLLTGGRNLVTLVLRAGTKWGWKVNVGPQGEGPPALGDQEKGEANDITAGLIGSIYADSSLNAQDQLTKIGAVTNLLSSALGVAAAPPQAGAASPSPKLALTELKAMNRAAEIPSLDNAAKILTGITALITGLFTGIGFTTGDFVRMIRDFPVLGITFLISASIALLLGTFAFVVNSYRSDLNLWLERIAVYLGIVLAGAAFITASFGLAQGSSAGQTRPVISASFNTSSGTPVLSVSVDSSNVPRSEHLTATVWGDTAQGWTVLSNLVTGPAPDGTDNASITVDNVSTYTEIKISALLSSTEISTAATPPVNCSANTSCFLLTGLGASPAPTASPTQTASSPAPTATASK